MGRRKIEIKAIKDDRNRSVYVSFLRVIPMHMGIWIRMPNIVII